MTRTALCASARRCILIHVVLGPKAFQQIETQLAAKSALDHLSVGSAISGSANPKSPVEIFVDRD